MDEDERCCGTGTCLINAKGVCWCGQQWNGTAMCRPTSSDTKDIAPAAVGALVTAQATRDRPEIQA